MPKKLTNNLIGKRLVFEEGEDEFDNFIFDVNDVEEKYYLSKKSKNMFLQTALKILKQTL